MKTKRSKATDIPPKVKSIVWMRDGERCIFCGTHAAMPNAHYIPRSKGGLGVERNIITACGACHYMLDNSPERSEYLADAKEYLMSKYKDWNEEELVYSKWGA